MPTHRAESRKSRVAHDPVRLVFPCCPLRKASVVTGYGRIVVTRRELPRQAFGETLPIATNKIRPRKGSALIPTVGS